MYTPELLTPEVLEKEFSTFVDVVHLLSLDKSLVLAGSTSVSVKRETTDLSGEIDKILFVSRGNANLEEITACDFSPFFCQRLVDLLEIDGVSRNSLDYELLGCLLPGSTLLPNSNLFLHAVIPCRFVFFTQPVSLTAISSTAYGSSTLEEIYKETLAILPYSRSGIPLAKSISQGYRPVTNPKLLGLFILNQGLVTFGDTPQEAFERINILSDQAVQYLKARNSWKMSVSSSQVGKRIPRRELAELRKELSNKAKSPMVVKTWRDLVGIVDIQSYSPIELAPSLPSHLLEYKYHPLYGGDVAAYEMVSPGIPLEDEVLEYLESSDSAPRIILDPVIGMCSVGGTVDETLVNAEYFFHSMHVFHQSNRLGSYIPLSFKSFIEEKRTDSFLAVPAGESSMFRGEIALVTGAASGIGKACAKSLLARGAAVVGLDISHNITELFCSRNFLGLVCDISDEDSINNAIDQTVLAFGGLDMLILNAGIFPSGCRIDAMDMKEWEKVMRINLHGNMALMRETFPLLNQAPRYGRVVINGSRNVKAPGPGASAYSASKAALTQLARVAALEWGRAGIRVNVVHPNAVFDTALYTEEVLKARAASYGITVEQYKKNNVLSVEITSHDVAEMVAEMCGPRFAKVTGAQVSIDGGSDRVI